MKNKSDKINKSPITGDNHRKKDLVSILAVLLFSVALFFEIFIIYWIPSLLKHEKRWEKDITIEQLVEEQDTLRAYFVAAVEKSKNMSSEIDLARACLDDFSRYLRENKDSMNSDQAEWMLLKVVEFRRLYEEGWKKEKRSYCLNRTLDPSKYIKREMEKLK